MFSTEPRCIYPRNALSDVICQLRFPDMPDFAEKLPEEFVAEIRKDFPIYSVRRENRTPGIPNVLTPVVNHQFATPDNVWRINVTRHFISLSCAQYTRWENFARVLDKPLFSFLQHYRPRCFTRIGLRYVNIFSRMQLGLNGCQFRDLFESCYLGPLADEDTMDLVFTRNAVDSELSVGSGCRAKIHAGPAMLRIPGKPDQEVKFLFDQDLSMVQDIALPRVMEVLETLHSKSFPIFRGAITDRMHDALMELPETE